MHSALADAPRLIPFGVKMVAPVLIAFGSAAQQQRFSARDQLGRDLVVPGIFRTGPRL